MFPCYLDSGPNWFLTIPSLTNNCQEQKKDYAIQREKKVVPCYFKRKKWIPAIWRPKMQFTTVRSKEKDYDIYLKSEKLVHSQQEHEKNVFQVFGSGKKTGSQLFRA